MSSFLTPKYLKYREVLGVGPGSEIQGDMFCRACGYNLRGLRRSSGRCPECGLAIDFDYDRPPILIPPRPEARRRIRFGLFLLVVSLAAVVTLLAVFGFSMGSIHPLWITGGLFGASVAYVGGAHLSTPPAFADRGKPVALLRRWVRRLSWCWLVVHAMGMFLSSGRVPAGGQSTLNLASALLLVPAVTGVIGLLLLLSVGAWDAEREDAGKRFEGAAWGLGIFSALTGVALLFFFASGLSSTWFALVPGLIFAPCGILWVGWIFISLSALLTLERSVAWPDEHLVHEGGRLDRVAMKKDAIDLEVYESIRPLGDAMPPPPVPRRNVSTEE